MLAGGLLPTVGQTSTLPLLQAMYDRKRQEHFERETKNWESNQAYYERVSMGGLND